MTYIPVFSGQDFYSSENNLDKFFRSFVRPNFYSPSPSGLYNLSRDSENLVLSFLVPGLEREEINISLVGRILTVEAALKKKEDLNKSIVSTFRLSNFKRSIDLDADVSIEDVDATLSCGILTVRVPTTSRQKSQTIQIK